MYFLVKTNWLSLTQGLILYPKPLNTLNARLPEAIEIIIISPPQSPAGHRPLHGSAADMASPLPLQHAYTLYNIISSSSAY
jgi:hypothetical protein